MEELNPCQQPVPFLESPLDVRSIPGMRSRGRSLQGERRPVGGSPRPKHRQTLPERCSGLLPEIYFLLNEVRNLSDWGSFTCRVSVSSSRPLDPRHKPKRWQPEKSLGCGKVRNIPYFFAVSIVHNLRWALPRDTRMEQGWGLKKTSAFQHVFLS